MYPNFCLCFLFIPALTAVAPSYPESALHIPVATSEAIIILVKYQMINKGINLKRSKEKIKRERKKSEAIAGKVWGIWRIGNWYGKHKFVVNLSIACFISSKPNWT